MQNQHDDVARAWEALLERLNAEPAQTTASIFHELSRLRTAMIEGGILPGTPPRSRDAAPYNCGPQPTPQELSA